MTRPDPWLAAAALFEEHRDYRHDPALWGQERLGEFYWSAQRDIFDSLAANRYTAVQSCHDAGKSFIASRAIAHWIDTHPLGEAFVVSTAPTAAQVSAILWREAQRAHKKGGLPGSITGAGYPQWKLKGGELVGYGRKPADYSESAFQGIHARYVLVVMDEAGGIDRNLYDAVDALATNADARVLAIGNPDDPSSYFATVCRPDSGWNTIRIDGLRTPNFTFEQVRALIEDGGCSQCRLVGADKSLLQVLMEDEGVPFTDEEVPDELRPYLLSPLWVEERLHRWVGRPTQGTSIVDLAASSALFTAKVRGLFPSSNTEGVIPLGWVERAIDRWKEWDAQGRPALPGRVVLGCDIASTGADETAIATRQGLALTRIDKYRQADTMETTGVIASRLGAPHSIAVVDSIGIGAGVVDRLREQHYAVRPFSAARSAGKMKDRSGEFRFKNLRAAAWWHMRELLDPSRNAAVMLPDSEILKADLCTPRWKVLSDSVIQIEGKDEIRKRLGRSTDEGDAAVMSYWADATPVDTSVPEDGALSWYDGDISDSFSWGIDAAVEAEAW